LIKKAFIGILLPLLREGFIGAKPVVFMAIIAVINPFGTGLTLSANPTASPWTNAKSRPGKSSSIATEYVWSSWCR